MLCQSPGLPSPLALLGGWDSRKCEVDKSGIASRRAFPSVLFFSIKCPIVAFPSFPALGHCIVSPSLFAPMPDAIFRDPRSTILLACSACSEIDFRLCFLHTCDSDVGVFVMVLVRGYVHFGRFKKFISAVIIFFQSMEL